jgi:hypothetical protein
VLLYITTQAPLPVFYTLLFPFLFFVRFFFVSSVVYAGEAVKIENERNAFWFTLAG